MSIAFTCPGCGKAYRLKEDLAGRTAKCSCGHTMIIPGTSSQSTAPVEVGPPQSVPKEVSENTVATSRGVLDIFGWKFNRSTLKMVFVSVAVVIILLGTQRSFRNWRYKRDYEKMSVEWQVKQDQARKDAQIHAQEAELKSTLALEERERQAQAEEKRQSQDIARYADVQFSQFPLTPHVHLSHSLGITSDDVVFQGEDFDRVRDCFKAKDWLKLIAILQHKEDDNPKWPDDHKGVDHVLHLLEDTKCFLRLKPVTPLLDSDHLLVKCFPPDAIWATAQNMELTDAMWVLRSESINMCSDFEQTKWNKHPDGASYVYEIRPGASDIFIIKVNAHEPLCSDMVFLSAALHDSFERLKKKKELGELSTAAYSTELLRLKKIAMAYCTLLLDPLKMHAPSGSSTPRIGHSQYKNGSLEFLSNCRNSEAAKRNLDRLTTIGNAIKESSSTDIQTCLADLDEQIRKCTSVQNTRLPNSPGFITYGHQLNSWRDSLSYWLESTRKDEQMAADKADAKRWAAEREASLAKCMAQIK